jgi:hypothetical protein
MIHVPAVCRENLNCLRIKPLEEFDADRDEKADVIMTTNLPFSEVLV